MQITRTISLDHHRRAAELRAFLEQRCRVGEWDELDIASLTRRFACCRSVLMRSFARRYGISVHAFIIAQRMAFAKRLLQQPSTSIKEIAFLSGYNSLSNFSRDFSRVVGVSPMAWRGLSAGDHIPADAVSLC